MPTDAFGTIQFESKLTFLLFSNVCRPFPLIQMWVFNQRLNTLVSPSTPTLLPSYDYCRCSSIRSYDTRLKGVLEENQHIFPGSMENESAQTHHHHPRRIDQFWVSFLTPRYSWMTYPRNIFNYLLLLQVAAETGSSSASWHHEGLSWVFLDSLSKAAEVICSIIFFCLSGSEIMRHMDHHNGNASGSSATCVRCTHWYIWSLIFDPCSNL